MVIKRKRLETGGRGKNNVIGKGERRIVSRWECNGSKGRKPDSMSSLLFTKGKKEGKEVFLKFVEKIKKPHP